MIPIRLIVIIILGAALAQPPRAAYGQFMVDDVTIWTIPQQPNPAEDTQIEIRGTTGNYRELWVEYEQHGNRLIMRMYIWFWFDLWIRNFSFSHNWGQLEEGEYEFILEVYWARHDQQGQFNRSEDEIDTTFSVIAPNESIVQLAEGWTMFSSHIVPDRNRVREVMSGLVEEGSLIILKNQFGQFYQPAYDFLNIPRWDSRYGYLIKVNRATELVIQGEEIAADTPIPLRQGWNMVSYFPSEEVAAPDAFAGIEEILIIAKDGHGNFYAPEQGFNNIPPLFRGAGYQIKVREAGALIWTIP